MLNRYNLIPPIKTKYKSVTFRSRLEARWAIFFDEIGWQWEYEPKKYRLKGGLLYVPDFRVNMFCFVEVKPEEPYVEEKVKAVRLAKGLDIPVVFGIGVPNAQDIAEGLGGYHGKTEVGWCRNLLSFSSYCLSKWNRPGVYARMDPDREDYDACAEAYGWQF